MQGSRWVQRWSKAVFGVGLAVSLGLGAMSPARAEVVFSTNFESGLPVQVSPGLAQVEGVQFFAGLGPVASPFAGSFLRSPTGNEITLTLTDLPGHTEISLGFLLAAIDSLDGTGSFPQGDFLRITLDGVQVFRESFANATASQVQSYVPPPGGELARRVDLGFEGPGSYYTDSAYDMFLEPTLQNLAHTASSAVFTFVMEGPGVQELSDESWAMDQLTVSVTPVPEPSAVWLALAGLAGAGWLGRRRR